MSSGTAGPKSTPLHKISRRGREEDLLKLLRQRADVTVRDAEGRTPLHLAVMRGHIGIIKRLLEYGGTAVLLSRDILNCTPVHLAAVQNQVQLISILVSSLLEDSSSCTPLHEVAQRGCMQDFLGYLNLGWDISACDGRNQEVLQLTEESTKSGTSDIRQILGWSDLHIAAMEGKTSEIEHLVKKFNCNVHIQSSNTWTALHYAAAYNQVGSIEALVRLGAKVDVRDSVGSTPLHVACGEGQLEAVLKLIQLRADPTARDRDGCTPLYCAAAWNRIEVIRELRKMGCPFWVQSEEGKTAVHVAAEQGWAELIEILVTELGCRVDSKDNYQFTPLHAAAKWGWVDAISILVDLNHAVDIKDYLGRTPLHYAAHHGRSRVIERLIQLGASHKDRDSRGGYTPLHLAADSGQVEAVEKLVELGADTEAKTDKGMTCLQLATMKGPSSVDIIETLVRFGAKLKAVTDEKNIETPLHIAARAGRQDIVEKLIEHGASVMARTKDGSTPLHYAAAFGQSHVIEPLVKAGCSVNVRDNARNTPLHLAAGCGFLSAVVALVDLGADVNARDMSECTPLQNTAHGTYSALAHVPSSVSGSSAGCLQGLSSLSLRKSGLSSAVLPKSRREEANGLSGMVPVRTGFAWATLGNSDGLANMCMSDFETGSSPSSRPCNSWKGAELMSLLRKATRGRRPGGLVLNPDSALDDRYDLIDRDHLCHHHQHCREEEDEEWERWSHRDFEREREGLELLLKKTEALQMSQIEQDRSRLLPVAEQLVQLGADIGARDNEGRTALHLAAGCGDKAMVLKLRELGADVNSRDSVGGTAMHHAAMANKKEMMYTLAMLGCDWRAKADGIDGASPAFVLCGQHGKTTRQQKLLEAKLRRVYMRGETARRSDKECYEDSWSKEGNQDEDYEEKLERADANMAALLEEEAAEAAAAECKRSSGRKKKKQSDRGSAAHSEQTSRKNGQQAAPKAGQQNQTKASESTTNLGARERIKSALEEAANSANIVLEIGAAAGSEAMIDVRDKIDLAIKNATDSHVGAKYAKKVRRKLQALIDSLPEEVRDPGQPKEVDLLNCSDRGKTTNGDDEGWIAAQGGGRRRQSHSRNLLNWEQVSQKAHRLVNGKNGNLRPVHATVAPKALLPQRFDEGLRPLRPSRMSSDFSFKTEPERGAPARPHSVESDQSRNQKMAWEPTHRPPSVTHPVLLSDPDFPPLQKSCTAAAPPLKRPTRKAESEKRPSSQSKNAAELSKKQNEDQIAEKLPQYELFGSTVLPVISTARRNSAPADMAVFDGHEGCQLPINSGPVDEASYSMRNNAHLFASNGYPPMTSYVQPHSIYPAGGYQPMHQYPTMYSMPASEGRMYETVAVNRQEYMSGSSPMEAVALQVAMECLDSDEIADKLPNDIPGLVESDTEEEVGTGGHPASVEVFLQRAAAENVAVLPRHLLGELASELEV